MIEDTWYVAGLRGTGSHHITLRDALVPEGNFFDLNGDPCLPGPLYRGVRSVLPLLHGSVSVGMAEGAVDELVELANTGRHQLRAPAPMRDSEVFQHELGRIVGDLRAAQALLQVQTASHWRHALAGTLRDDALVTQATQAATWIVTTCVRVADACFALGGGSALYDSSPLQRRLRDLHAAAQHAIAQQRNYASAGKLILNSTRVAAEAAAEGTVGPRTCSTFGRCRSAVGPRWSTARSSSGTAEENDCRTPAPRSLTSSAERGPGARPVPAFGMVRWAGTGPRDPSVAATATGTRVGLSSQAWDRSSSNVPTAVESGPRRMAMTDDPPRASRIARLALVGAIVGAVLGAFAYAGGWLTPWRLTPEGDSSTPSS